MIGQVIKQRAKSGDQQSGVVEMRAELARKIAAHVQAAGEQATAIPGLTLYPTDCADSLLSRNVRAQPERFRAGAKAYNPRGNDVPMRRIDIRPELR